MMAIVTVYSLFADDIQYLAFTKSAGKIISLFLKNIDNVFNSLNIAAFSLFVLELIISSISKEEYFMSFYFWLDLVSTASMITDIS